MLTPTYDYHRPQGLEQAWRLKQELPQAQWIAGGTDLLVQLRSGRRPKPEALISLRSVAELTKIQIGHPVRLGAMVPVAELALHPEIKTRFAALVAAIDVFASQQIRNVATLGGNLCNASPAADTAPPLLVHEARVELTDAGTTRVLALEDFMQGPGETALGPNEILTAVLLDPPATQGRSAFLKKGRTAMDVAVVSVAAFIEMEGEVCRTARLAAGAVAPMPLRLKAAEAILEGAKLTDERLAEAARAATEAVAPIDDLRSSAEYRRHLVGVYVRRAVSECLA